MRTNRKLALVQAQTAVGEVFANTSKAIAIEITEISRNPYEGNTATRTRIREGFGASEQINVGPYATVQLTVPLSGSGTLGVAPSYRDLLIACGLKEIKGSVTDSDGQGAGEGITYVPISDNYVPVNFWYYYDGEVQQLTDALGTAVFTCNVGELPTIQFTLTGLYRKPEKAEISGSVFGQQAPEIPVNYQNTKTFEVMGYNTIAQSFALDMANTVAYQNLVNFEGVDITDRQSNGQIQVKAVSVDVVDYFKTIESHIKTTTGAVRFVHGTEDGNIFEFNGPRAQMSGFSEQDQDGEIHYQMTANYLPSIGGSNDDFSLTFR